MLDTMTFTKVLGGFCGALLVFLLGNWAAESLYHVDAGHGEAAQAYVIEVAEAADTGGAEAEPVDFETLMASADASAGESVFSKCRACHKLEQGANAVGPYLHGVVGREIDTAEGYSNYSGALEQVGEVWTPENLFNYLESPRTMAPGTSMSFAGLPDPEDRVNLIAYLDATDD